VECKGGPYCYAEFATAVFFLSALMYLVTGCPHWASVVGMTWYTPAQTYLQIFGFFAIAICGAAYEALPGVMGFELPFRGFVRAQHWCFIFGLVFLVLPLAVCGIEEGLKMQNPAISFGEIRQGTLVYLRVSTLGLLGLLVGGVLFAVNIFAATAAWQTQVAKSLVATVTALPEEEEVKS
jgi:cbb3-type cytochrome oxidase subunit 1